MSLRHPAQLTQHRASRITSAPSVEPVTASELRVYLKMDSTQLPDATANELIEEARQFIEDATGLALITQSWQLNLDHWPDGGDVWWSGVRQGHRSIIHNGAGVIDIPRWPMQSVTSVKTYDESGNETAVTVADTFDVDAQSTPARVALQRGATWPTAMRAVNAIEMVYVAGYGDAATDVPAPLKRAVKQLAAQLYTSRGDSCSTTDAYSKSGAAAIVGQYRVKRV
jgi:uncharacterized phiE125 gp8 family phage protein